ncbi:hypothetical protein D3C71_1480210 [compost metagenome]
MRKVLAHPDPFVKDVKNRCGHLRMRRLVAEIRMDTMHQVQRGLSHGPPRRERQQGVCPKLGVQGHIGGRKAEFHFRRVGQGGVIPQAPCRVFPRQAGRGVKRAKARVHRHAAGGAHGQRVMRGVQREEAARVAKAIYGLGNGRRCGRDA